MSLDISNILREWPYEHGQVSARRIHGDDGHDRIQLRLDLGLLQMTTVGRPDGARPHGFESMLDYYEHKLANFRRENGTTEGFDLDERACELLRSEGVMYYHRYLAEFILEDYEGVERDTLRNVRLFDFMQQYAKEESDRYSMEQYRPYVVMMCARARGRKALREERPQAALAAVKRGIEEIREFYRKFGQSKLISSSGEIAILRNMVREIEMQMPVDPVRRLRDALAKAVREERYEDAANLRDQLVKITAGGGKESDEQE